eukprot:TRINITY_DN3625_c0_g1_i3.p1 TRINITY_DN3625_c0_g1~~TRINITY_DN3625_c0_g1_i3.p1  ORF type:complete len:658 (+),score=144.68 TRINITY_DN3625_c0_g1_i3:289-1974(+)
MAAQAPAPQGPWPQPQEVAAYAPAPQEVVAYAPAPQGPWPQPQDVPAYAPAPQDVSAYAPAPQDVSAYAPAPQGPWPQPQDVPAYAPAPQDVVAYAPAPQGQWPQPQDVPAHAPMVMDPAYLPPPDLCAPTVDAYAPPPELLHPYPPPADPVGPALELDPAYGSVAMDGTVEAQVVEGCAEEGGAAGREDDGGAAPAGFTNGLPSLSSGSPEAEADPGPRGKVPLTEQTLKRLMVVQQVAFPNGPAVNEGLVVDTQDGRITKEFICPEEGLMRRAIDALGPQMERQRRQWHRLQLGAAMSFQFWRVERGGDEVEEENIQNLTKYMQHVYIACWGVPVTVTIYEVLRFPTAAHLRLRTLRLENEFVDLMEYVPADKTVGVSCVVASGHSSILRLGIVDTTRVAAAEAEEEARHVNAVKRAFPKHPGDADPTPTDGSGRSTNSGGARASSDGGKASDGSVKEEAEILLCHRNPRSTDLKASDLDGVVPQLTARPRAAGRVPQGEELASCIEELEALKEVVPGVTFCRHPASGELYIAGIASEILSHHDRAVLAYDQLAKGKRK